MKRNYSVLYLIQEVHRKRRDETMIRRMNEATEKSNVSKCKRYSCGQCQKQKECIEYASEKIMKQNMEAYKELAK